MRKIHTDEVPLSKREIRRLISAAIVTPLGYLAYHLTVWTFQGYTHLVELPRLTSDLFLGFLVFGITGALTVLTWSRGFRAAPVAALGTLLGVPWLYVGTLIINLGYATLPFVALLLVIGIEGAIRFRGQIQGVFTRRTRRIALAAGLLHFVFGFGLQMYARGLFWLDYSFPSVLLMGFIYIVSGIALLVAGVLPVVLWSRYRLVTPAVATVSWFIWGVYGIWLRREALPLGAFTGIGWGNFTPHPDYLLKWTGLMVILLMGAGTELVMQRVSQFVRTKD